ncbi:hypothetical protein [Pseudodonghicola flavimaris]|uniref:Uncharacterized protein n=1 Tax=Pseudodonghicola flavimaris TaxID=3050036 RepID=A0ABT7EW06_9RHOB|nr:hypothetical protein [Pseudodonghicola flavimaris]MDK3016515.1 hypothetical protein [Pseudodonghicola flavimaris]
MTTIQTTQVTESHDGAVIPLPAVIGHSRPTGIRTVFPRGAFDRELQRDCEADGANHFAQPREVA